MPLSSRHYFGSPRGSACSFCGEREDVHRQSASPGNRTSATSLRSSIETTVTAQNCRSALGAPVCLCEHLTHPVVECERPNRPHQLECARSLASLT
jgi:hypothetical protein